MYHERQHLQHCLKHTINSLLQQEAFTTAALNQLCDSIQASRTRFLGNYDANVLVIALQQHGLEVKWHDSRDTQLSTINLQPACAAPHLQDVQPAEQQQDQRQVVTRVTGQQQGCGVQQQQQQQQQQEGGAVGQQQQQHDCVLEQQQQQQGGAVGQQQHECVVEQQQQPHLLQQQDPTATPPEPLQIQEQLRVTGSSSSTVSPDLSGIVLNVKGRGPWAWLTGGRHWLAIRHLQGQWWNLDSHLSAPQSFVRSKQDESDGGAMQLRAFLKQQLQDGAHILLVHKPSTSA